MIEKVEVIVTVGISVVTNYLKKEDSCLDFWEEIKNYKYEEAQWNENIDNIERLKKAIVEKNTSDPKEPCAELQTLNLMQNEYEIVGIHLVYTDTIGGKFASDLLVELLKRNYNVLSNEKIDGLNFEDDGEEFEKTGFGKLIEHLEQIKTKREKENKDEKENIGITLNISGGYKAIIPFLTIYAQLTELALFYVYEDSRNLITINPVPLKFDWAIADLYYQYLTDKNLRKQLSITDEIYNFLLSNHLINDKKELTTIGILFENYIKKYLPQRQDVIGHYMEHKIFEAFFEHSFNDFTSNKIGLRYWWDLHDKGKCSLEKMYDGKDEFEKSVEIDIQLIKNSEKIWIECKPYSEIDKAIEQIKKYSEFNELALKENIKSIGIFIYKFEFQNICTKIRKLKETKSFFERKNINFFLLYFDLPFNKSKATITYKNLFEKKLILNQNLHLLQID
jgi:putative CRISPR-associated protein (TIGR02619 family)